jgi:predicted permease
VTVSAAKLIVAPGLFLGLGALLGFRGVAFVSLIGVFASPTAVNSFTMAQQMGGDAELAGDIVVTTSAVSIPTMFLWIFLFKSLGVF